MLNHIRMVVHATADTPKTSSPMGPECSLAGSAAPPGSRPSSPQPQQQPSIEGPPRSPSPHEEDGRSTPAGSTQSASSEDCPTSSGSDAGSDLLPSSIMKAQPGAPNATALWRGSFLESAHRPRKSNMHEALRRTSIVPSRLSLMPAALHEAQHQGRRSIAPGNIVLLPGGTQGVTETEAAARRFSIAPGRLSLLPQPNDAAPCAVASGRNSLVPPPRHGPNSARNSLCGNANASPNRRVGSQLSVAPEVRARVPGKRSSILPTGKSASGFALDAVDRVIEEDQAIDESALGTDGSVAHVDEESAADSTATADSLDYEPRETAEPSNSLVAAQLSCSEASTADVLHIDPAAPDSPLSPHHLDPVEESTPLQQLLSICGQDTDVSKLPSMDALLSRHLRVDLKQVRTKLA